MSEWNGVELYSDKMWTLKLQEIAEIADVIPSAALAEHRKVQLFDH